MSLHGKSSSWLGETADKCRVPKQQSWRKCTSKKLRTFYDCNGGLESRRGCSRHNSRGKGKDIGHEEKEPRRNIQNKSYDRHLFAFMQFLTAWPAS